MRMKPKKQWGVTTKSGDKETRMSCFKTGTIGGRCGHSLDRIKGKFIPRPMSNERWLSGIQIGL